MASERTIRRFRAGEADAVRELYAEYGRAVYAVARRALGDRDLAEEAVQQTFLKAWRAAGRFEQGRDPAPWLYAIARRVAIDLYRREKRHRTDFGVEPEIAVLSPTFEHTWQVWEVRTALDKLPDDELAVVRATHYLGLSHSQAADELGVPVGTIKSRSHRAHRRLSRLLAHLEEATA